MKWERELIRKYAGQEMQLFGIKSYTFNEGRAANLRALEVDSGAGMRFTVIPDRGMDITFAQFGYENVAHITKTGMADPRFYEPRGGDWLRTYAGGLITTCGFYQIGDPADGDGDAGLHGRLANTPACEVCHSAAWEDGRYVMRISGKVRDAVFYGENITLHRKIIAVAGENTLQLRDDIENQGCEEAVVLLLYHMNFGYPLVENGTELAGNFAKTEPLNEDAAQSTESYFRFGPPEPDAKALLYTHTVQPDKDGMAAVYIKGLRQTMEIRYNSDALPCLTQWKNQRSQDYVLGIEPGTGHPIGRTANLQRGTYRLLEPGERMKVRIRIGVKD